MNRQLYRRFEVDAWVWWCQNVTHLNRYWKYACIKKYYPLMLAYLQKSMLKFFFEGFKDLVLKAFLKIIFLDSILVLIHHFLRCCPHATICCPHAAILSLIKYIFNIIYSLGVHKCIQYSEHSVHTCTTLISLACWLTRLCLILVVPLLGSMVGGYFRWW